MFVISIDIFMIKNFINIVDLVMYKCDDEKILIYVVVDLGYYFKG